MRLRIVLGLCGALGACASAPSKIDVEPFLADARVAPAAEPVDAGAIFALNDAMRRYLEGKIADRARRKGPRVGLFEVLSKDLRLEYDAAVTRNAAEAFDARTGNCLSLVLLTAAFAKQMDIPVTYQSVYGHDTWSRGEGIVFRSSHVNIVLGPRGMVRPGPLGEPDVPMTIDFLPPSEASRLFARPVAEDTVLAMYFNNRAAETLSAGDPQQAYWWARAALRSNSGFVSAFNTLGVIYRRLDLLPEAERALRHAHRLEPENASVLANLAAVLEARGRLAEAGELRRRATAIAEFPPYHFLDLGITALRRGETNAAIDLFKRELKRMPYDDQLHFMMALARLRQGELRQAQRHMTLALENSITRDQSAIYAAKLDRLREMQTQIH
jgi:Tfp pilus assembly protein PilF